MKRNRSVDGIEIMAHYDHGDPTRDVVLDGYAILPVIEGQTMTSITLRVPGTPKKSDQTMPVHYTGRIVQSIDADLGSMAKPAFPQMILDINADHSLSPPGHLSRGRYRKASPEAMTGSGKGGSENH